MNYACIPAKAVLRSADILSEIRSAAEFGIDLNGSEPVVNFSAITDRRSTVMTTLTGSVSGLLKKNGVELIPGEASLTPVGDVKVGDTIHTATRPSCSRRAA